ncbi:chloride channel protein [Chitinivibrio alkaliphilus]|uniref:CLC channel n=1 Tax=Chitinivibrio alkaliphilus ACht1 TaxID=1313304 RepID=U7D8L1_9BACT|nr:chloride channel protein [Chitinivibrio alkaliphilus]ERP31427.1 CLC channel [Chitinivibrio alkaliphilus ACht1]
MKLVQSTILRILFANTFIILSTLKWFFLAIIAGVLVGGVSGVFLKTLDYGISQASMIPLYYLAIPAAFMVSLYLVRRFAPDARGHGTEKVIESLHKKDGEIDTRVIPVKLFATLITLIAGGSAGKEGPCAQIGAGVASTAARIFRMGPINRKRFVLCGISAGFSAVFGTPIAGAIFAGEVIYVGKFSYRELMPALIASYFSFFVTKNMGVTHLIYQIDFDITNEIALVFNMLFLGIIIGIVAIFFIYVLYGIERTIEKIPLGGYTKAFWGGLFLVLVVFFTGSLDYVGLGTHVIDHALAGNAVAPESSLLKMITTSITLGSGGSGGILTPIFFIGATAGNIWAQLVGGNLALYSAVGMCAFLAATTNTPLAAILIAIELFGVDVGSYGSIACIVSYLIVGHMSVYPSQVLSENKTFFMHVETHREMGEIDRTDYVIKDSLMRYFVEKMKGMFRR